MNARCHTILQIMYMTRPTAPCLVLNGSPICLQLSNPDSPGWKGSSAWRGTWAPGGLRWVKKGWFIGQSVHYHHSPPHSHFSLLQSLPLVAGLPILPPLGSSFAWLSSLWRVRESSQAVSTGGGSGLGLHWEGWHLILRIFLPRLETRYQSLPARRVPGNGKGWRHPSTSRREEGKEGKRGLRGHWEHSYFCALSGGGASIAQLTNFFPNLLCEIWLLPEGGPFNKVLSGSCLLPPRSWSRQRFLE